MDKAKYVDKQSFIADVETGLKDKIPVTALESVRSIILATLTNYDVVKTNVTTNPVASSSDLVQMFIDAKLSEGCTKRSMTRYAYILNKFFFWENVAAMEVTSFHIRDFFAREKKRGIKDSTIGGYKDIFNSFYKWLLNEGIITRNPCGNIGAIKCEQKVRQPLSNIDVQKLFDACDTKRDKAMVAFLLNTGCRVAEFTGLKVKDVDLKNREFVVYGKGRKERIMFFDTVTAWYMQEYLDTRKNITEDSYFFATLLKDKGRRLSENGVRAALKRLSAKAGVEHVSPHRFRHTFATDMIIKDMPIQDVAVLLGHTKIDTTQRYIHLTKERSKMMYDKFRA